MPRRGAPQELEKRINAIMGHNLPSLWEMYKGKLTKDRFTAIVSIAVDEALKQALKRKITHY